MGENIQIFHIEEFKIIYVNTLPPRRQSLTLPLFTCGCTLTSFQRLKHGKRGKRITSCWRNLTNPPQQVTKVNINRVSHVDTMYFLYDVMGLVLYLYGLPPKTHNPRLIMRKTYKSQLRDILHNTCTALLKTVNVFKIKSEKVSQGREV